MNIETPPKCGQDCYVNGIQSLPTPTASPASYNLQRLQHLLPNITYSASNIFSTYKQNYCDSGIQLNEKVLILQCYTPLYSGGAA